MGPSRGVWRRWGARSTPIRGRAAPGGGAGASAGGSRVFRRGALARAAPRQGLAAARPPAASFRFRQAPAAAPGQRSRAGACHGRAAAGSGARLVRPGVRVLMAVHNGEPHLRAAVESVLAQTYPDFELLIVDDGSTDGSADVVRSYEDRRIRLLENERNLGQIPSLNRALREAHGEYVARLDHDDLCLPERLERQVEELDAEPSAALAGTWIDVVDEDGRLWATVRRDIATF